MAGKNFVPNQGNRVLVINPGATSTKFGVFNAEGPEWVSSVHPGDEEIEQFRGRSMLARTGYRAGLIEKALSAAGSEAKTFAAVAERGGLLPAMSCGTYLVDDALIEEIRKLIEWIAPISVYGGEDELQALAEEVFRVLNGEETPKRLESQEQAAKTPRSPGVWAGIIND